jgi:NodT family efflux transporter outer membrane factor (OMF) lipoprotein
MDFYRLYFLRSLPFLLSLLSGCTVGPNYHPPEAPLPSKYSLAKPKVVSQKTNQFWSSSLSDPILIGLMNQALSGNNLDLQKAYANICQARAELGITRADFFPQLNASGKISRDRLSANSEILVAFRNGVVPLNYTDYKFGFDASWELDFFGRIRRGVEASRARFHSAIENQYNVAISTAAEVANVYTQYRVYQQRIIIAQKTIRSYSETVKLVKLQMQAGSATGVDLSRVESEVLSAQAALPPLQAEAKATLAALAVLVGEYPESLFKKLSKIAPIPIISTNNLSVGIPSDLLLRRPDIKMAERDLAAATADIGVAIANQFPRFQLVGDLGSDTTIPGAFFNAASGYWSIGPQVSIPIFQGGRLKNAVRAQKAAHDSALASYKQTVLQALADVESSLIRYDRERLRKQKVQASYNKLKSALRLIKLQYSSGQTSLIDVLDVERQLNQLADEQVQSAGQVTINLVSLYKALGGGWRAS